MRALLAQRPRFHLHFDSTSPSWLNQVERRLGRIRRRAIERGSIDSVPQRVQTLETLMDRDNASASFLVRAAAGSIFETRERLSARICGTPRQVAVTNGQGRGPMTNRNSQMNRMSGKLLTRGFTNRMGGRSRPAILVVGMVLALAGGTAPGYAQHDFSLEVASPAVVEGSGDHIEFRLLVRQSSESEPPRFDVGDFRWTLGGTAGADDYSPVTLPLSSRTIVPARQSDHASEDVVYLLLEWIYSVDDDELDEGNETVTLTVAYLGEATVTIGSAVVVILDDDETGVEVAPGSLAVDEEGPPASYEMRLRSQPSGTVTVTPSSDHPEVTVSPSALTFTTDDWNQWQAVEVAAGHDDDAEDETAAIRHAVSGYGGVTAADPVTLTILDDDETGVEVLPRSLAVNEAGPPASYEVRLLSQPSGTVTVTPSSDNPEVTVSPSALTFTTDDWNQPQTVAVTAHMDADHADGTATIRHAVSGYGGVTMADSVMVSVLDSSPDEAEIKAVEETLQAVAAGSLANVTTNIGARFSATRSGSAVSTLAGQSAIAGRSGHALAEFARSAAASPASPVGDGASLSRGVSAEELLQASSFELALNAAEDGAGGLGMAQWTLWGRGDILVFDSDPSTGARYDGDLLAGYLGLDAWLDGQWLVGVAASRTRVDATYRLEDGAGQLDVTLSGVHPYLRFAPNGRMELWAILGAGTGEVRNARSGPSERERTDVEMYMAAAGARQALEPRPSGMAIALLGDVGIGRLTGGAGTGLQTIDNLAVDTWRARAGAEVSYTTTQEGGASITPFAELTGRVDGGGEDDTKAGVELAAGVAYADPASGFGLEARGRALVLYSGGDYREYGASLTASLSPGAGGEGLSLALSPRLGNEPGRADALWRENPFRALHADRPNDALSLTGEIGYGIAIPSVQGLVTPFGALGVWHGDRSSARAGVRFGLPASPRGFHLELAGARDADGLVAPEHRMEVIGRMRF